MSELIKFCDVIPYLCIYIGFPLNWKVRELIWLGKSRGILSMVTEKCCVSSELHHCCLFVSKTSKYTLSACYNKMVMERSRCRAGGAD